MTHLENISYQLQLGLGAFLGNAAITMEFDSFIHPSAIIQSWEFLFPLETQLSRLSDAGYPEWMTKTATDESEIGHI